jgi:predicted MPP superfamily phosphohydrolase
MLGIERLVGQIDPKTQKQLASGVGMLLGFGAGLAGYSLLHEPLNIHLEELTLVVPRRKGQLPARGLRILHLSDTHFRGLAWRERAKIERIRTLTQGLEYDLLVHTGDFWHEETGLQNLLTLLDALPRPRLGGYGVFGNHDHVCYSHSDMLARNWERYQQSNGKHQNGNHQNGHRRTLVEQVRDFYQFGQYFMNKPFVLKRVHFNNKELLRRALADKGVEILNNRSVHLCDRPGEPDGVDLHLAGVDDVCEGWPDVPKALAAVAPDKPTILLSHNPDILQEEGLERADVILCGHTHGGQIVLPWLGPVHTHSDHLARHEVCGYMQRGKTHVYVTRGVGEGIPLRFGARPQITLITIRGSGR